MSSNIIVFHVTDRFIQSTIKYVSKALLHTHRGAQRDNGMRGNPNNALTAAPRPITVVGDTLWDAGEKQFRIAHDLLWDV